MAVDMEMLEVQNWTRN